MKKIIYILTIFIIPTFFLVGEFFNFNNKVLATEVSMVQTTIKITVCGNNIKETGEQCDGSDLNGVTCSSYGFSGGTLSCRAFCDFDTSACTLSSGNGGGGGGSYTPPTVVTSVIFLGRAYPESTVTILKDAQVIATTKADAQANFQLTISNLTGGNYLFSIYSEDYKGVRSSLLTFPINVTTGASTKVSGIFVTPTIMVDKSEVKRGDNVVIFGQTFPNSDITIAVNSAEEFLNEIKADVNGIYLYNFDSSVLEMGRHYTKSKTAIDGEISSFSKAINFVVGSKTVFAQPQNCPAKGDLNNNCHVNLIDFSIMAYWHKRSTPPTFYDLNGDGKIDLIDFSIMAFYWTG